MGREIVADAVAYHRNGISGAPFHVVKFRHEQYGNMIGIVFEEEGNVAVLNVDQLCAGEVRFARNSWRGDKFEGELRNIINSTQQGE